MRAQFLKGKQRKFIDKCIENLNSPSLRGLLQFGIRTNSNNLKNYYSERRTIPKSLFDDLSHLAKINISIKTKNSNWGQVKGGKISRRK